MSALLSLALAFASTPARGECSVFHNRFSAQSWSNPMGWPIIPVPEVATDPVSGTTLGVLPVFLCTDSQHQIQNIFAPDINYNTEVGPGGTLRYLSYPSNSTQWFAIAGGSEQNSERVELDYTTGMTHERWWSLEGHFFFQHDPTFRFFGLHNDSPFSSQSNYTKEQLYAEGLFGVNLTRALQIALGVQPQYVRIQRGALNGLPFTGTEFPTLNGLQGGSVLRNRLFLLYDTRNSLNVPTSGGLISLFGGGAARAAFSSFSYAEFGGDIRRYVRLRKWLIVAGNIYTRYIPTRNIPFWQMSELGGDGAGESSVLGLPLSNVQTWRGYGAGRFVDNNVLAFNLELRMRVYQRELFNTNGILELAPFMDLGRVFQYVDEMPLEHLHPVGGLGFRGIALPFVVGYVDIGYGQEGVAVFSGINYPF